MNETLHKAIDANSQMLYLSEQGRWEEVLNLSKKRDLLLRKLFAKESGKDKNKLLPYLDNFFETDKKITDKIMSEKSSLVAEGISMRNSHNAIKSYQSAQSH